MARSVKRFLELHRIGSTVTVLIGLAVAMPVVFALAGQQSDPQSTPDAAASPSASPQSSPVVDDRFGRIIITLADGQGEIVGGACWQILQGNEVVDYGCDREDSEYGYNGRLGLYDVPPGEYQLVQSFTPDGFLTVDPVDITIEAGDLIELVFAVERVGAPAASPMASPESSTPEASPTSA
jgi:hypothetical protein